MLTLFELLRWTLAVVGMLVLGSFGWNSLGFIGAVIGLPIGLVFGAMIGQVPLFLCLYWMAQRLNRMTEEQLLDELHAPSCPTPNLLLLELRRRGYDIYRELEYVHGLLASREVRQRTAGWAALNSAFPELVDRVSGYSPSASWEQCQANCRLLLTQSQRID